MSPAAMLRTHGCAPKPEVNASFQSFVANSNATYKTGSSTLTSERIGAIMGLLLADS
jgi:hypothetical protein